MRLHDESADCPPPPAGRTPHRLLPAAKRKLPDGWWAGSKDTSDRHTMRPLVS